MLLAKSGETAPGAKRKQRSAVGESVVKVISDAAQNNTSQEPGMSGP